MYLSFNGRRVDLPVGKCRAVSSQLSVNSFARGDVSVHVLDLPNSRQVSADYPFCGHLGDDLLSEDCPTAFQRCNMWGCLFEAKDAYFGG